MDCGNEYPYYVMDFDHVRGTKKFGINGTSDSHGIKAILEEVEKCDIVCSNCHRIRTARRAGYE